MTITSIRPIRGELPPGTVDGYCTTCAGDTIVSAPDYACPACGIPVHPDSLPRDARLAMMRGQAGPQAADSASEPISVPVETVRAIAAQKSTAAAAQPVAKTVRATRSTRKLDASLDEWVAEAESAEAAAKARMTQAKRDYERAAQEANYARQMRQLVRVDGAASAPAASPPPGANGKRWARDRDACRICGLTTTKHAAAGRCRTCDSYWRHRGSERPTTTTEAQTHGN